MRSTFAFGLFTSFLVLSPLVGLTGACSNDDDCALSQCINNVNVYLRVALPADAMRESTLKVCRNSVCSSGKAEFLPAFAGDRQKVIVSGPLTTDMSVDVAEPGKSYSIAATIPLDATTLDPAKDLYELRVLRNGTEVRGLAELAKYQESTPNGPTCPTVCTNATIGTP